MKWPRLMLAEFKIATALLFQPGSWLKDKHLRAGYILSSALFVFALFACWALFRRSVVLAFGVALILAVIGNIVWLGYAAYSRAKESS